MGHQYNKNVSTPCKGYIKGSFTIAVGAAGAPTIREEFEAGFIQSVVLVATGIYRCTISSNHRPHREGTILPKIQFVNAPGANTNREVYYRVGTYNATTGVFDIQVMDRAATPAQAIPADGDHIHVEYSFPLYKNM